MGQLSEQDIANGGLLTDDFLSSSVSRIASFKTADQTNLFHRGVTIFLNGKAGLANGSSMVISVTIQGKRPGGASSDYVDYLSGSSFTLSSSGGIFAFTLFPGLVAVAGPTAHRQVSGALPRIWRVKVDQTTQLSDYSITAVRLR